MISAAMWCTITGILWTGVGIYFSVINQQKRDPILFNLCSAIFLLFICAGTVRWKSLADANLTRIHLFPLALVMISAGAAIAGGMLLMIVAMRKGHSDVVWSICQSSMIIPFSLGVLVNGEPVNIWNMVGVATIITGITIFGQQKKNIEYTGNAERGWFILTMIAFFVIGAGQYCFSVPSYWSGWNDQYALRIPLQSVGGFIIFLILARPSRLIKLNYMIWLHGVLFAVLTYAGRYALYRSIDALEELHIVAIAYPVCLGLSILGFVCYHSIMMKRISNRSLLVSILLIVGLFLIGNR